MNIKLTENWKLRDFHVGEARDLEVASPDFIDYFWMTTIVPGDIHTTLREKGIIDDPFLATKIRNAVGLKKRYGGIVRSFHTILILSLVRRWSYYSKG